MSYYTVYTLECDPPIDVEHFLSMDLIRRHCINRKVPIPAEVEECSSRELWKFLVAAFNNTDLICALGRGLDGGDPATWYEHERDMGLLSKLAPSILFTLSGKGEEDHHVWKKYFKNGLCQEARATFTLDEFDENKLK